MMYVEFQKWIPASRDKNINFEEVRWYQQIYTCFTLWKYQFWWSRCFSRNVYLIQVIQISIFMKYVDFQNCIPVSGYKNINFDEVVVFSRNVYLILVIQISIFMKYVDFQKWIPVSRDQNINFEEVRILMKSLFFQKCIPDSSYTNIYLHEVRWFPEMYTCFMG